MSGPNTEAFGERDPGVMPAPQLLDGTADDGLCAFYEFQVVQAIHDSGRRGQNARREVARGVTLDTVARLACGDRPTGEALERIRAALIAYYRYRY